MKRRTDVLVEGHFTPTEQQVADGLTEPRPKPVTPSLKPERLKRDDQQWQEIEERLYEQVSQDSP